MAFWRNRKVLVTGGASFIGSHLVEALVAAGADVRVIDDLSSGDVANLDAVRDDIELRAADLHDTGVATKACAGREMVFHLAADHGGRGYIDRHQVNCASNFALDQVTFQAALSAGVSKVVFASSGCVYPLRLQSEPNELVYLREPMVGPPYEPDGLYGMAKLAGELTLQAMHREHHIAAASCRYFTVYGPRALENHAVMAMIARAFARQDPFEIWGNGDQVRNWTHVDDIVRGTLLAAEKLDDATAVNLGTSERVRVRDSAEFIGALLGHDATIRTRPEMPTGPTNRVADGHLARQLLGFETKVSFRDGVASTVRWYVETRSPSEAANRVETLAMDRRPLAAGSSRK